MTLNGNNNLKIEPVEGVKSLRGTRSHIENIQLLSNKEILFETITGNAIELSAIIEQGSSSMVELNIFRSPLIEKFSRICFYNRRGNKYRVPFPNDRRANQVLSLLPYQHQLAMKVLLQ